jgi:hypothetical protein
MVDVKINNADYQKLQKKFKKLHKYSKVDAITEVNRAMSNAQAMAVASAPVAGKGEYGGTLKGSIQIKALPDGAEMYSTAHYAPYVEFGTGSRYVSPNDATELGIPSSYIAQFKGKGIKEVNLKPRPFFYSSVRKAYSLMLTRVNNRLKRITNE